MRRGKLYANQHTFKWRARKRGRGEEAKRKDETKRIKQKIKAWKKKIIYNVAERRKRKCTVHP